MNTENFGELIQHDDDADTRLEADQYWFGNEIRDEAEPQQPAEDHERADKPSRNNEARTSKPPTISVNIAEALRRDDGSAPGTTSPSSVAVRTAMVVVVLTLSGRDVPISA